SELVFDHIVRLGIVREHLQTRASANHVVRQRVNDASRMAVVGDFIACSTSENPPHLGVGGCVGGQVVGVGPMPTVLIGRLGGVVPRSHPRKTHTNSALLWSGLLSRLRDELLEPLQHECVLDPGHDAPGGTTLVMRMPSFCFTARLAE